MLVLSRMKDEVIMVGDEIEIRIVEIRGHKVRVGITAPKQIDVHRREVYELVKAGAGGREAIEAVKGGVA